ncbi:hypothetical protein P12x_001407 [Tundrisphaera lichenicola]|uniref:hypothetical protein n=1 Tax=Tundrisphaera lichenicola TaxID=2029860 RepID=UPI003EB7B559
MIRWVVLVKVVVGPLGYRIQIASRVGRDQIANPAMEEATPTVFEIGIDWLGAERAVQHADPSVIPDGFKLVPEVAASTHPLHSRPEIPSMRL